MTLDDLCRAGFVILAEEPDSEIVLGLVGRFWVPHGELRRLDPGAFACFGEPGYAKAVWNFRVEQDEAGSVVSTETRVATTDGPSHRSFARYWRLVGPFSALIRRRALRLIRAQAEHG